MVSFGDGMERAMAKFLYDTSMAQAANELGYRVSNNLNKEESWPEEKRMQIKKERAQKCSCTPE